MISPIKWLAKKIENIILEEVYINDDGTIDTLLGPEGIAGILDDDDDINGAQEQYKELTSQEIDSVLSSANRLMKIAGELNCNTLTVFGDDIEVVIKKKT